MSRFTTLLFRRVGGTWEPQLMHRFTEITSAIPLPSIQKGEQPLNKKALRGLFFIYYISPKVGSPESRTQQLVRSRFWLAPFYVISKATFRARRSRFLAGTGPIRSASESGNWLIKINCLHHWLFLIEIP